MGSANNCPQDNKQTALLRWLAAVSCVAVLLTSCISTRPVIDLPQAPKNVTPRLLTSADYKPYELQVGDVMDIKLMLNPELNDQVTVRPDGMISTTLAGEIRAAGRTTKQVQKDLETEYRGQLQHPHIAVLVRSFAPTRIYVTGEVASPGEFISIGPTLTLLQAVSRAGGIKNSADPSKIIILRRENGEKSQAYAVDYKAAVTGDDPSSDVRLAPYDVVYVPRSDVGNAYLYFQQYIQQFVPVSFGVGYEVGPATFSR